MQAGMFVFGLIDLGQFAHAKTSGRQSGTGVLGSVPNAFIVGKSITSYDLYTANLIQFTKLGAI